MTLLEATKDPAAPDPDHRAPCSTGPLAEIAAEPWVTAPLAPILERHRAAIDIVRRLARVGRRGGQIDLAETGVEGANKFIAYDLFPDARYTVVVTPRSQAGEGLGGLEPLGARAGAPTTSRSCASGTAAAATPSSARSRSTRTGSTTPAASPARSRRSSRTEPA